MDAKEFTVLQCLLFALAGLVATVIVIAACIQGFPTYILRGVTVDGRVATAEEGRPGDPPWCGPRVGSNCDDRLRLHYVTSDGWTLTEPADLPQRPGRREGRDRAWSDGAAVRVRYIGSTPESVRPMPQATHIPLVYFALAIIPPLLCVAAFRVGRLFRGRLRRARPKLRAIAAIRAARQQPQREAPERQADTPATGRPAPRGDRFGLAAFAVAGLSLGAPVVTILWHGAPHYLGFGETVAGSVMGMEEDRHSSGRCNRSSAGSCALIVTLRLTTHEGENVEARSDVMISRESVQARRIRVGSTIRVRYLPTSPMMVRPMPEATAISPYWLILVAFGALWGAVGVMTLRQHRRRSMPTVSA